jgi:DnaJ-class molecular chaperone
MEDDPEVARVLGARTFFDALGLPPAPVEPEAVKRAYRAIALRVHPDKNTHGDAKSAFQALQTAYDCLVDEASQAEHLTALQGTRRGGRAGRGTGGGAAQPPSGAGSAGQGSRKRGRGHMGTSDSGFDEDGRDMEDQERRLAQQMEEFKRCVYCLLVAGEPSRVPESATGHPTGTCG